MANFIKPETGRVHPFSVTPNLLTVSHYKTPIAAARRLLHRSGLHSGVAVEGPFVGGRRCLDCRSISLSVDP